MSPEVEQKIALWLSVKYIKHLQQEIFPLLQHSRAFDIYAQSPIVFRQ